MNAMKGLLLLSALAACHHHRGAIDPSEQQQGGDQTQQPAPPVDNRNPAEVCVDILKQNNYTCVVSGTDLLCAPPGSGWQFAVWYENQADGTINVMFDSFVERAFGKPCSTFQQGIDDLRDDTNGFSATCDDNTHRFRLSQRLVYDATLDVPGWANDHLQRRLKAGQQLRSIGALSKDDARALH